LSQGGWTPLANNLYFDKALLKDNYNDASFLANKRFMRLTFNYYHAQFMLYTASKTTYTAVTARTPEIQE